jgi:hypothetical protein
MRKRTTYLVMKTHDRLTLRQGQAVLKALSGEVLSGQDKPNLLTGIAKLIEACEDARYRHEIRCERDERIAKAKGERRVLPSPQGPDSFTTEAARAVIKKAKGD